MSHALMVCDRSFDACVSCACRARLWCTPAPPSSRNPSLQNMFAMYLRPVRLSLCRLFCRCTGRHSYAGLAMVGYHRPQLQDLAREALGLCVNLEGFTWSDDKAEGADEREFVKYLDVLHTLPLRELIIRTFHGLSDEV